MATGWAGDGAVNDQIDATVKDAVERARRGVGKGNALPVEGGLGEVRICQTADFVDVLDQVQVVLFYAIANCVAASFPQMKRHLKRALPPHRGISVSLLFGG